MNKLWKWLMKKKQPDLAYSDFLTEIRRIDVQKLPNEEIKERMVDYQGKTICQHSEYACIAALVKEIILRQTGLSLFDSQLATSFSLLNGRIAELPTGEGKTLAAVIPAVIHAMEGLSVYIFTFNDYLAARDYQNTKVIYEFCGLTVGYVTQKMTASERKRMYGCNIVYLTAKEAGFDYLKNFLCTKKEDIMPIQLEYAIVDEADSLMIDESRNPLVIGCDSPRKYQKLQSIRQLITALGSDDVAVCEGENQAYLTDSGIEKAERYFCIDNLFKEQNTELLSMINMALQAEFLLKRDVDYIVFDDMIQIVDESTGRVIMSKKYPDLLHASVEVKEGVPFSNRSMIYHMMTLQNFLLLYHKLSGMSGTARTSETEFYQVYGLEVDVIPPHIPCRRIDHPPVLLSTKAEKYQAIMKTIETAHSQGQPVLVGTQSIEESENLSAMLWKEKIFHQVLNAKNDHQEAALITESGKPYAVTVSTNMAGRGVDIKLGGIDESRKSEVTETGGLLILGTGFNRSVRIDNQLRGRAGRQGDAGESRFFASLEDELLQSYKDYSKDLRKDAARAQKHAEGVDEESRLILSKYAYLLEHQRKIITEYRNHILFHHPEKTGLEKAEKQLTLHYINLHWAEYLEFMDYIRDGIHLTIIGGSNPIDEYQKIAVSAFDEVMDEIKKDVIHGLEAYPITENGIDMEAAGLGNATSTWTYLIDESKTQFSSLPRLLNGINNQMKGTLFSLSPIWKFFREKSRIGAE